VSTGNNAPEASKAKRKASVYGNSKAKQIKRRRQGMQPQLNRPGESVTSEYQGAIAKKSFPVKSVKKIDIGTRPAATARGRATPSKTAPCKFPMQKWSSSKKT
jgi:hypothetical protein